MSMHFAAALLAAVTAALGACLCCCGAGSGRWIGFAVLLAGAASLALSTLEARRQKKKIEVLHGQLIDFLEGRDPSPRFSVEDDDFALLENAVVELESRLLLEQKKRQLEAQKNAAFIADVSHQLKTPLASLKLYCEMDRADNPGEHGAKQLALIERMEQLIYSLLRLEKLRADAYELHFAAHDLADLTAQVWEELRPLYPDLDFRLAGRASMRCDAYWIGEALKNILKNSCEHTAPGGWIRVLVEAAGASIMVTVEDNGGGIPEEELPRLFQRFYRSSRAAKHGGAGLGLAITRTIVEKHHGTVYAENSPQGGLRITLCFPVLEGVLSLG